MPTPPFESFAQNGEDVVLWRALRHVDHGSYIEVGANHPTTDSLSRSFYDHGWQGILVEPGPYHAQLLRTERHRDFIIEAAVTSRSGDKVALYDIPGTGLSTIVDEVRNAHELAGYAPQAVSVSTLTLNDILDEAGWAGREIHFLSVDTEGAETEVLESIDFRRWRPWILVIESTSPNTSRPTHGRWERHVLDADYQFCLFDGLSRFYVAAERADEIGEKLSIPANVLDNFTTLQQRALVDAVDQLNRSHSVAVGRLTELAATAAAQREELDRLYRDYSRLGTEHHLLSQEHHRLHKEFTAMHETRSWRFTKPFRAIRARISPRKIKP